MMNYKLTILIREPFIAVLFALAVLISRPSTTNQQYQTQQPANTNVNNPLVPKISKPQTPVATISPQAINSAQPTVAALSTLTQLAQFNNHPKVVAPIAGPPPPPPPPPPTTTTTLPSCGSSEDPIIYLDYSTITDAILRKPTVSIVYFNANFNQCRNCHKFFNTWKELAIDVRCWRQVVKLYTINCSDEDNIDMCRRAGATLFPQVKFYWIMSNSLERDGQRLRVLGKSVHAMRHLITDKVLDSYMEHNKMLNAKQKQLTLPASVATSSNPIASLMSNPMLSQMFSSGLGGANSNPLSSLMSALTAGGNKSNSSGGGASLSNLMNNLGGIQGISQLINTMASASSMRQRFSVQPLPNNWPELEAVETIDTQHLLDTLPLDSKKNIGALLIMETQEFLYTGLEVMLDLSPYANQTYFARVRDERSQLSKNLTKRDDIQAPALIYVTPLREIRLILTAPKYTNDEDLRKAFVRTFERRQVKYPVKRVWSIASAGKTSTNGPDNQEDEEILNKLNQLYVNDVTNALRASLMEQVFRHPDLSDDQYNALVKYVYVLINYFPFQNDESLKFFKRLHSWLQNQVSPIDIAEYKRQFHDINDVLDQREWVACKSLSSSKAIPSKSKKAGSLFENPAQFGKVVSNITRLFRGQQQQMSKLKNLFSMFNSNVAPVMLTGQQQGQQNQFSNGSSSTVAPQLTGLNTTPKPTQSEGGSRSDDSPIVRIIKSLTSGSLGSDSSILKLIATTLTGGSGDSAASTGKSKFAREYPCGIWKLAHVMVVNEYIKDSPRKDVKHIVLHSLYQYMVNFYACSTCGNRVSDVSAEFKLNLDDHLEDQADSVMLLWKFHNRVSKRLESETRPGSPAKLQFPSEALCPKCRAPRPQNDLVSTPNWHEKQVLSFLIHHYRPQSFITSSNSTDSSASTSNIPNATLSLVHLLVPIISSIWLMLY